MKRIIGGLAVAISAFAALACSESLESSAGCPALCPTQNLGLREAIYDAISDNATVGTFPPLGVADHFVLAVSGDSVDARMVVRFDSLPKTYTTGTTVRNVTGVDSAHFRIVVDTLVTEAGAPVTFELYNVDTTAADGNFPALLPLFRPDRLLGTRTFQVAELKDTISVPVPNQFLLARILEESGRVRVGLRIRSTATAKFVVLSANQARFPRLKYDPAPEDNTVNVFDLPPRSRTPAGDPFFAVNFTDFALVADGAFPLAKATGTDTADVFRDSVLVVGGLGRRRVYLRFQVPDSVLRASIVRATLILNQKPAATYGIPDSVAIVPQAIFADAAVPVSKALLLRDTLGFFPLPPQRLDPADNGEVRFEIVNFARNWTVESREEVPHAISLRAGLEGRVIHELLFYSTTGPAALRPRLRITFVPR